MILMIHFNYFYNDKHTLANLYPERVLLCVLSSLSDFNMLDCTVFCEMLVALVAHEKK